MLKRSYKLNKSRPLEPLNGENRGIVRQILGRFHLSHTRMEAVREVRSRLPKRSIRTYPVALRRGLIKCIFETWDEYQRLYKRVMLK